MATIDQLNARLADYESRLARGEPIPGLDMCVDCKAPLQETITGRRHISRGDCCSDCYFKEMGKAIDEYPIYRPRPTRG